MEEYDIKVKDLVQDCTHRFTESGETPNEANQKALKMLKGVLKHDQFEIVFCKPRYRKYTYTGNSGNTNTRNKR